MDNDKYTDIYIWVDYPEGVLQGEQNQTFIY